MGSELPERDPLDQAAESFLARLRAGEDPALSEYEAKYPDLAADIRDLFPALALMEQGRRCLEQPAAPDPARLTAEQVPEQLGEYRLLREIGRGGMGVVYEARQESLGRHVALKVLPFNSLVRPEHLERFRREARAAARLHHTNIVPVYGVGEHQGIHYYAMQFIHGQGLDLVLQEVRRLRGLPRAGGTGPVLATTVAEAMLEDRSASSASSPEAGFLTPNPRGAPVLPASPPASSLPTSGTGSSLNLQAEHRYFISVARIGAQAGEALEYAHSQAVIHRDIKPSNLLLDTNGRVWITDFGLAKAEGAEELTQPGDILGTLRYMSPERFHGQADERSDVYGLGITLYELLTLRPAFEQAPRGTLVEQITHVEPPRPRKVDPRIPRDLETIALKAMAKEPGRRYPSAGELAEDLHRFLADRPIRARRATWRERAWRWCRRNPAVASSLALAVILAVVLAGGSGWFFRDRSARAATLEAEVRSALAEAREHQFTDWARSDAAARRARSLLAGGGSEDLRHDVDQTLAELQFQATVEEARLEMTGLKDGGFDSQAAAPLFARAFHDYNLPVLDLEPGEAARRIAGSAIAPQLVSALASWLRYTRRPEDREKLLAVARILADANPAWRRLRLTLHLDAAGFLRWAHEPDVLDQPPADLVALGCGLWETGQPKAAVDLLRRAQRRHPRDFWINHYLGYFLRRLRPPRLEEAIGYYRLALALRPQSPGEHVNLSAALIRLGRFEEAEEEALDALRLRPAYSDAYLNLGSSLMGQGRAREAETAFRQALRLHAESAVGHYNLGNALGSQARYEEAAVEMREAIRLKHDFPEAHTNLGAALIGQRRYKDAEVACRAAILVKRDHVEAHNNLGEALTGQGRDPEAAEAYRTAIRIKPDYLTAHYNLAVTCTRLGRWQEAITHYSRVLGFPGSRVWRAHAYSVLGRWHEAAADLAPPDLEAMPPRDTWFQLACLRLLQDDPGGYQQLCRQLLEHIGRTKEGLTGPFAILAARTCLLHPEKSVPAAQALAWAEKAVAAKPKFPWYLHTLALAHYRAAHFDQAVRYCKESHQADPLWRGDMLNEVLLAMACERRGQRDEARRHMETAARWRAGVLNGTYRSDTDAPPDVPLSCWLEFQILFTEAQAVLKLSRTHEEKPQSRAPVR